MDGQERLFEVTLRLVLRYEDPAMGSFFGSIHWYFMAIGTVHSLAFHGQWISNCKT